MIRCRRRKAPLLKFVTLFLFIFFTGYIHQQVICFAEDVEDEDSESESGDSNSNEYYDKEDENEEVYYNYTYVEAYNDEVELDDVEVFYKAETDDDSEYVITAETANIYVSSISEVLVCLFVTFFWILWLVGEYFFIT